MNWSSSLREKAAQMFEQGYGYKAVASKLNVNRETVRDWSYTWRALGTEEFLAPHSKVAISYDPEIKLAVAKDRVAGMGVVEVMAKYHILNRHRVKDWVGRYLAEGEEAFLQDESFSEP